MLSLHEQQMTAEMSRGGFAVEVRVTSGPYGKTRYNLAGRGPHGAIFVSAPTEAEAYRSALDQVRTYMVPAHVPRHDGHRPA